MSSGVTCTVLIDGQRLADGSPGDSETEPTALSGLGITWGRSTTVDQPDAATCAFDVYDLAGGVTFLELLRTGRRVDVLATGTTYPDPDVPTILDPTFDDTPEGDAPPGSAAGGTVTIIGSSSPPPPEPPTRTSYARNAAARHDASNWITLPEFGTLTPGIADFPGADSAMRWTRIDGAGGNSRLTLGAYGSVIPAATQITLSFRTRASHDFPLTSMVLRRDASNATLNAGNRTVLTSATVLPAGVTEWTYTALTPTVAPTDTAGVTFTFTTTGLPDGAWFEVADLVVELGPTGGPFFDGDTPDVPPTPGAWGTDYSWWGVNLDRGLATPVAPTATDPAALLVPTNLERTMTAEFAPAPFSELPAAWDEIPTTQNAQIWTVGASVLAPAGTRIRIRPVYYTRPDNTRTLGDVVIDAGGTGDWLNLTAEVQPAVYGAWVGVAVELIGWPRWVDMPGTWADTEGTWLDYGVALVDDLVVEAPGSGNTRSVLVFSGRITDMQAVYDPAIPGPRVSVTASDFTADLDNIDIGDEPWAVETMEARFLRILALSGSNIDAQIDDSLASVLVSYQDVDNQATTALLKDLAQSVDGVLWAATHQTTGAYLRVEDPANRAALYTLTEDSEGIVRVVPSSSAASAQTISACDILRDPVEWVQDVSDVSTRVAVSWLEQGTDEEGNPETTERTETVIDGNLEEDYGVRRISVSTILQNADDAIDVATRVLGRTSMTDWRASGLTIDDDESLEQVDSATVSMLLRLLDGTSRIGLPIRLVDLPPWSPSGALLPVYLEGGQYDYVDGTWTLALIVSQATTLGGRTTWADLEPEWAWVEFDPAIDWVTLQGVTYPNPAGKAPR